MMFFILPYKVNAVTYQETNQSTFQYNINNFSLIKEQKDHSTLITFIPLLTCMTFSTCIL